MSAALYVNCGDFSINIYTKFLTEKREEIRFFGSFLFCIFLCGKGGCHWCVRLHFVLHVHLLDVRLNSSLRQPSFKFSQPTKIDVLKFTFLDNLYRFLSRSLLVLKPNWDNFRWYITLVMNWLNSFGSISEKWCFFSLKLLPNLEEALAFRQRTKRQVFSKIVRKIWILQEKWIDFGVLCMIIQDISREF